MFDLNGDGFISVEEMNRIIKVSSCVWIVVHHLSDAADNTDDIDTTGHV